jgi:ribosomal protein S18 acetylase RimI-like enzyme
MSEARAFDDRVIIRRAKPQDAEGVAKLGLEALERNGYDRLVIDPDKVRNVARLVLTAPNYCVVAEKGGEIIGAVSALVHENLFYERKQCSVVQFYCREPGVGVTLIRSLLEWARSRPVIKMISFTLEVRADPRIAVLLRRLGLASEFPVMAEFR